MLKRTPQRWSGNISSIRKSCYCVSEPERIEQTTQHLYQG